MKLIHTSDKLPQHLSELVGNTFFTGYEFDLDKIKKYDKFGAIEVVNEIIVDYKKTPGSDSPRVYTVESVNSDGIRLFQVGTYENPLTFKSDGTCISQFRSKNWTNWRNYVIIPLEEDV